MAQTKKSKQKEETFEGKLKKLENIVEKMEKAEVPLEDALGFFESGIQLTRELRKHLDEAERKIEVLLAKEGEALLKPFNPKLDESKPEE